MNERLLTQLKARRAFVQQHQTALERFRDAYRDMPDLPTSLESESRAGGKPPVGSEVLRTLHRMSRTAQMAAENDIGVMAAGVRTLDRVIDLVEADREDEARELFSTLGDLGKQFTQWPLDRLESEPFHP